MSTTILGHKFPDIPEGFRGCVTSLDGKARVHVGPRREEDPLLAAQRRAGEEDQTQPGWDAL
jgi:hypothetical protein